MPRYPPRKPPPRMAPPPRKPPPEKPRAPTEPPPRMPPPPPRIPPPPPPWPPPRCAKPGEASRMQPMRTGKIRRIATSRTNIPRIQAPRDAHVRGAFDDGPAVGKDGQQIGRHFKPEREFIGANRPQRRQPGRKLAQLQRTGPLMNLHRVVAT